MSATGRGPRLGGESDYYATPAWCTRLLLDRINLRRGTDVLDPCAGGGAILSEIGTGPTKYAIEIRSECSEDLLKHASGVLIADYLTDPRCEDLWMDWIITNPPYRLAAEFVRRSMAVATGGIAMLLRLNFLGSSRGRADLFCSPDWGMPAVYVLERRPSFVGGRTDACEYAWFVWYGVQYADVRGRVEVLR